MLEEGRLEHYQAEHHNNLLKMYHEKPLGLHYRFKLDKFIDLDNKTSLIEPTRLNMSHENDLIELYQSAYPQSYFTPRMLESEKYLGYFDNEKLVAVSGVHVDSDEYNIAVLGNIAVHPEHRNKGLATTLTSLLVEELVNENKLICLNVKADNSKAITIYRKLGFEKVFEYNEGFFELIV